MGWIPEVDFEDTLDGTLDSVLPLVKKWSKDFEDSEIFINKRWLEIKDYYEGKETLLHLFRESGEYLWSIDGNIMKGTWQGIQDDKTIILENSVRSELFDLEFLNEDFMVLSKHGDQRKKNERDYLFLGNEKTVKGKNWEDCIELLFEIYKSNYLFSAVLIFGILGIVLFILFLV
jgi:hypothetical protein